MYTPMLALKGFSIVDLGISVAEGAMIALVLISLSFLRDKMAVRRVTGRYLVK